MKSYKLIGVKRIVWLSVFMFSTVLPFAAQPKAKQVSVRNNGEITILVTAMTHDERTRSIAGKLQICISP